MLHVQSSGAEAADSATNIAKLPIIGIILVCFDKPGHVLKDT